MPARYWKFRLPTNPIEVAACLAVIILVSYFCMAAYYSGGFNFDAFVPYFIFMALGAIAFYVFMLEWSRSSSRRRAAIVLAHIEDGVRLRIPLSPAILAAANSESGGASRRLFDLHDRLERGQDLGTAVYYAVPELPRTTANAITAAEKIGCLPQMLRRLVRRAMPRQRIVPQIDRFYKNYAVFVSILLLTVLLSIIAIVVMPKFISIFRDFHATLPWTTQLLLAFCNSWLPVIIGILLSLIAYVSLSRGAMRDYVISYIPVIGSATRDQAMADLCEFLVDALEAGRPLDEALAQAEGAQPNAVLRRQIRKMSERLTRGGGLAESARASGMPSLLSGMLNTVRGDDDLVQVLSFLARHFEYRFSRWRELMYAAGIPIFVGVVGAFVVLVELSVFQPIIALIDICAEPVRRHIGGF